MNPLALAPTTLPDTPPCDYVAAAISAGYDRLGMRLNKSPGLPYHPVVGDAPLIREIKARLADSKLTMLDILSFYLQPGIEISDFTPALALGAELGAQYAMVMGDDPDWPRLRDNFGKFCDEAGRFGLSATIEFVPARPLATMQLAARIIEESGRKNAVIVIDPLHFTRTGGKPEDVRALPARYFPYSQITDGKLNPGEPDPAKFGRMGGAKRRMIGDGDVKMDALLDVLPPELPLSVEIPIELGDAMAEKRGKPFTPAEWAKVALDNTRGYLEKYYARKAARA